MFEIKYRTSAQFGHYEQFFYNLQYFTFIKVLKMLHNLSSTSNCLFIEGVQYFTFIESV